MLIAAIGFAIMNACARQASRSVPFLEVALARALVGLVVVVGYARLRSRPLVVRNRRVMLLRVTSGTLSMILTFFALSRVPLGEASALLNLTPLFVAAIGAIWLGERVSLLVGAALGLGLLGALLVYQPQGLGLGVGGLAAVGAALTAALAMTSLRRLGSTESAESVVAAFLLTGTVVIGLLAAPSLRVPSAADAALMFTGGVTSTIAQLAMTRAYALDAAARVGGMNYLNIVASLLLSVIFFGEHPGPRAFGGIAAIVLSGAALVWSQRQEA
jgi:drug/metabolite transporter (DMT)-like permease